MRKMFIPTLFFLSLLLVNTAHAAKVVYVHENGSDIYDGSSWTHALKTLNKSIDIVENGGIIYACGKFQASNITINKNLSIVGKNTTIFDGSGSGILEITPGNTVKLVNLIFVNGNRTEGGAIINKGCLIIENCTFINNTAIYGGAIRSYGNLTIKNSLFKSNVAFTDEGRGGAINCDGAQETKIENCEFWDGIAPHNGGAIYGWQSGYIYIKNCKFVRNKAPNPAHGGAIYVRWTNVVIENSEFINNTAEVGGALRNHDGVMKIVNCTFIGNIASGWKKRGPIGGAIQNSQNMTIENSTFINNFAEKQGGAIENSGATLIIKGCSFLNNKSPRGSAIYNTNFMDIPGILTVSFSRFVDNEGDVDINSTNQNVTAELNWWGQNNPDFSKRVAGFNVTKWLVLKVIPIPERSEIKVSITSDNYGNQYDPKDGCIPPTPVLFKLDPSSNASGILKPEYCLTDNGECISKFITIKPGTAIITTTVDHETISTRMEASIQNKTFTITLTNLGKSTITIKYYISIYTNPVNGTKVSYRELTITLKPNETKTIELGKYLFKYAVSGTMIVKNPSRYRIPLNLRIKYEIEGLNPQMREISKYIAPRGEFRYIARYTGKEEGYADVW